jgi:hypothetical protein
MDPLRSLSCALALFLIAGSCAARSVLFVGNSFTYGQGSAVRFYRAETVSDLNGQGIGGVPALFKSFAVQLGLPVDVYLETHPGVGLDWHLDNERAILEQRPWDLVVLQGYSTLDPRKPGDPARLVSSVHALAGLLHAKNPAVEIRLDATWPRPDQIFLVSGGWFGKSLETMAGDVRAAYELAAAGTPGVRGVVKVGDAWLRAIHRGVADGNPYDGIDAGKIDLWTYDHYHASTYGYYLEALMLFGSLTGRDPRALGDHECSGFELGLAPAVVGSLQTVAFEQLAADGAFAAAAPGAPGMPSPPAADTRCAPAH